MGKGYKRDFVPLKLSISTFGGFVSLSSSYIITPSEEVVAEGVKSDYNRLAGRSAVRLARSVRDAEVGGSNPLAPTSLISGSTVFALIIVF